MNYLLTASEEMAGDIGSAALFALVGFVIVIAALAVLIVLLIGLTKLMSINLPKRNKAAVAEESVPLQPAVSDDTELVAAITAAIMTIYSSETNLQTTSADDEAHPLPFVIKSIKKI